MLRFASQPLTICIFLKKSDRRLAEDHIAWGEFVLEFNRSILTASERDYWMFYSVKPSGLETPPLSSMGVV